MRLFVDEDASRAHLIALLQREGHEVSSSAESATAGKSDAVQLTAAIRARRALLSHNHDDFEDLHILVRDSGGHHAGILIVRKDHDPRRDMTPRGILVALNKLIAARVPIADEFHVLNHWRPAFQSQSADLQSHI